MSILRWESEPEPDLAGRNGLMNRGSVCVCVSERTCEGRLREAIGGKCHVFLAAFLIEIGPRADEAAQGSASVNGLSASTCLDPDMDRRTRVWDVGRHWIDLHPAHESIIWRTCDRR